MLKTASVGCPLRLRVSSLSDSSESGGLSNLGNFFGQIIPLKGTLSCMTAVHDI